MSSGLVFGIRGNLVQPVPSHPFHPNQRVLTFAHRGGLGAWPENTLFAFKRSLDRGVDVLDMDLRSTADGALVILHDRTVDRTTDGTGRVQEFTLEELKKLDAGYRWSDDGGRSFPYRGQGIRVPTLAEVFSAFPEVLVNIEIKSSDPSIGPSLCRTIHRFGMTEGVIVASGDAGIISEFRRLCPETASAASFTETLAFYILNRLYLGAVYRPPAEAMLVPEYLGPLHVITPDFIRSSHRHKVKVYVWTMNDLDDIRRMMNLGVDGILTDYPDRLLTQLGR